MNTFCGELITCPLLHKWKTTKAFQPSCNIILYYIQHDCDILSSQFNLHSSNPAQCWLWPSCNVKSTFQKHVVTPCSSANEQRTITIGAPIVHMCHTKEIDTRTLTSTTKGRLRSMSSVCVQQQERLVQFNRWALSMHVALIPWGSSKHNSMALLCKCGHTHQCPAPYAIHCET
jgi:hypothetical protein